MTHAVRGVTAPLFALLLALGLAAPMAPAPAWADWDGDTGSRRHDDSRAGRHDDRRGHAARQGDAHHRHRHEGGDHQHHRDGDGFAHHHRTVRPGAFLGIVLGDDLALYWGAPYVVSRRHRVALWPPLGARVRHVPAGYVSFLIGPSRYFFVGGTYYLWDAAGREYLVVSEPAGADAAMDGNGAVREELFAYPARGQGEATREWDRYACHEWALAETGSDRVAPGASGRADYLRAVGACLEGRGYAVR